MKFTRICLLLFLSTMYGNVFAGELSEIELTDGSKIYGEIVSLYDGVYTINSDSLGTLQIGKSEIRLIKLKTDGPQKGDVKIYEKAAIKSEIKNLQKSIIIDGEIMNMILSLMNDPQIQEVLQDPDIMNALNSGDIASLLSNPKFKNLLNNPRIQEIQKKANIE